MTHPNETKTPRCDQFTSDCVEMDDTEHLIALDVFARQLEMELNDISTELNELRACNVGPWEAVQLQREIEDLRKHNEQLISATKKANDEANRRIDELCQARAEAQRLLGVDAKLKDALLEVERLKRDVAKAVWDVVPVGISTRSCSEIFYRLGQLGIEPAMAEGGQE